MMLCDTNEEITMNSKENLKSFYECEQVVLYRSVFDQKLFPSDFDTWNIKEQYIWINENITKFFPNMPKSLIYLIPAIHHQLNSENSSIKAPEWLDIEKYRRGQKFVRKHYFSVIFSHILSLMFMFSFNDGLKSFIVGNQTHTLHLAFKRYLSTIRRIISWYNGEPWIEGLPAYANMQFTRRMHSLIRKKLDKLTNEQIDNATKIAEPWCPDRDLLLKDFSAMYYPFEELLQCPYLMYEKSPYRPKGINNADMAFTQGGIIASILLCPQNIGIHDATNEDIEAFCHMWRCYGYFFGIEDEYNFCRGSLEEIKQRTQDVLQYMIIANLKNVTPEWEHMTRTLITSLHYFLYYKVTLLPYKVMTLIVTDVLKLNMPLLYASLNFSEWITYKVLTFMLRHAMKLSSVRVVINMILQKLLDRAAKFKFNLEQKEKFYDKS